MQSPSDRRPPRPGGWEERLAGALAAARSRPWAWGTHDCATFAERTACEMLNGPTAWSAHFQTHRDARTAARILRRGGGLVRLMDGGACRISPALALRGDVAAVDVGDDGPALGVVMGEAVLIAAAPCGWRAFPLARAGAAWPVDVLEQ